MSTIANHTVLPRCQAALSDIYYTMAGCYRYLGRGSMTRLYEQMAIQAGMLKTIMPSPDIINEQSIPALLEKDLSEFSATGTLRKYSRLLQRVPAALLDTLEVKGIAATLVRKLYEELNITSEEELKTAILSGALKRVRGFSNAKIDLLKRNLKLYKSLGSRLLLWDAILQGNEILRVIKGIPEVDDVSLTGSLRRGAETVGDIDMVVSVRIESRADFIRHLLQLPQIQYIVSTGWRRVSVVLYNDTQLDIRLTDEKSYGASLIYYTGSLRHVAILTERAEKRGYLFTPMGLFNGITGVWVAGDTEGGIFKELELAYVPPELREGGREIYRAGRNMLPQLVTFSDIRGDMRIRTDYEKGGESLNTIARYAINAFPHYEYLVVADQLPFEMYHQQFAEIDRVNSELGYPFLKKGIVVEMTAEAIAVPEKLLREAEWVTAIINEHEPFRYRQLFISACDHPLINCIANPTGRIIGARESSTQNWDQLFKRAVKTGTALEVNAQPQHLDLSDRLIKGAAVSGVKIVINSCAQLCSQYDYMQMGVIMARRGWCGKADILNTGNWENVQRFKQQHLMTYKNDSHEKDSIDL
ncbi:DNA polymerase (family 10) [Chitinophaga sp. YR627]|uniref:hypothetical protein n=1 Tax=Chitinophaga sp. YR627 TaxID=1881041 RepID=UPI0008E18482|nr:hypothetical protein [Chitinophaga sp. YR627]SFM71084.1 DNA polymerase (family 10) [Chitinophaga sp. YR627]